MLQYCSLACGKLPRLVLRSGAVAAAAVAQRKEAERTHARHLEMFVRGTIADLQARSPPAPLCVGCFAGRAVQYGGRGCQPAEGPTSPDTRERAACDAAGSAGCMGLGSIR
jgi:hypothetical protein